MLKAHYIITPAHQAHKSFVKPSQLPGEYIDEFQINEINVDLRTSGFDNEVLSVDACAVWWERESFYCLPRISVVTWHREPRFQCGSARTCSIWNSSIQLNCCHFGACRAKSHTQILVILIGGTHTHTHHALFIQLVLLLHLHTPNKSNRLF